MSPFRPPLDADPSTGYLVYDSVPYDGASGWFDVGGTSGATPAWAGLVAIADQGLALNGSGNLSTGELLNDLYSLPRSDFNDVTDGSNGYSATAGYDLVTGLGTPRANLVVTGLVADASGSSVSSTTSSSSSGVSVVSATSGSPSPTSPTSTHTTHKHAAKTRKTHAKVTRARVKHSKTTKARAVRLKASHGSSAVHAAASSDLETPVSTAGP